MKKRISSGNSPRIFCFFCTLLCVVLPLSACQDRAETGTPPITAQHGQAKLLQTQAENYDCNIYYPVIGNDSVDAQIKTQAENFAEAFVSEAQDYRALTKDDKGSFNVDYQLFSLAGEDATPRYFSVLFLLNTNIPGKTQGNECIRTLLFDIQSARRLQTADIFLENSAETLSEKIRANFQRNPLYRKQTDSPIFLNRTSAAQGDFSRLSFSDGSITFYFDSNELFPDMPVAQAVFTPQELRELLRPEIYEALSSNAADDGATTVPGDAETTAAPPSSTAPAVPNDGESKGKAVALTFDDGPSPTITPRILALLAENDAKATFFLIGVHLPGREEVVRQAVAQGHEIGNHTYEHKFLTQISKAERREQMDKCSKMLREITGKSCRLFRPPDGYYKGIEKEIKMPFFLWSIDTNDWCAHKLAEKPKDDPERMVVTQAIVDSVLEHVQDGDIILMHDIYEMTADACEQIIPGLAERGYRMLTVSELFAEKEIELKKSTRYRNAYSESPAETGVTQKPDNSKKHLVAKSGESNETTVKSSGAKGSTAKDKGNP